MTSTPSVGRSPGRSDLQPGQVSRVMVHDLGTHTNRVVLESTRLIEAPNWTPDGELLVVNCEGGLFTVPVHGGALSSIDIGGVTHVNNDHVLSPDGTTVYFSAAGHLYSVPITGGETVKISNDHPVERQYSYWLHGVSPDGQTLAYVSVEPEGADARGRRNLATIPVGGGPDTYVTEGPARVRRAGVLARRPVAVQQLRGVREATRPRPDIQNVDQGRRARAVDLR